MTLDLSQLEAKDWIIVCATILGPILAVQAQKWVERIRERRGRKLWVFQQLMATRAARVSTDHVQALNMIDLVFYGSHPFGIRWRSRAEQTVLDAWKEYHDHLNQHRADTDDASIAVWISRGDELFVNLLFAIAKDVRYRFDRVQLKSSAYSPRAHGEQEFELNAIRRQLVKLLSGEQPLKMEVASLPVDPEALKAQIALSTALAAALAGQGALTVAIKPNSDSASA
jgi:hypothetical protein